MAFCVLADVELLLQVKFETTSDPTSTAVEGIISQIDARIRQALAGGGISVPFRVRQEFAKRARGHVSVLFRFFVGVG